MAVIESLPLRHCFVPRFPPLELGRAPEPFSHPDYLFEIKWDGFRSLLRIEQGRCRLISRKGNEFKSFRTLNKSVLAELKVRSAVLDGEIVCLNDAGKSEFRDLLHRRGEPRFVAFDLLFCEDRDKETIEPKYHSSDSSLCAG
jgi:bifunctional non-homologous end joining protein LigD